MPQPMPRPIPQIDAVVFDIGNVLLEWNPQRFYDRRIGPDRRAALFAAVDLDGMNLEVDRGAPFAASVRALAAQHPDWAEEIALWETGWLEMASPAIPGSVELLHRLRAKGVRCLALSNFGIDTFRIAQRAYPFLDSFDQRFISGHLGLLKPDPAIYAHVERESGIAPEALFFTDDRADNIAAAAERGWQTHLFEGPERLKTRLEQISLI